jgi:ADP-ribose pyrophosphatase YjhB (NUDIX family)
MITRKDAANFFTDGYEKFLPHVSVDCVIFGFHHAELKLLLLKWKQADIWMLPGGYIGRRESLDAAAHRVLRDRTGLKNVFLHQFHAFGGTQRKEATSIRKLFATLGLPVDDDAWPLGRVISIGYYALVDFSKVRPQPDYLSEACAWHALDDRPALAFDHDHIVTKALETLRSSLDSPSLGATLLPERFTMPELQRLHEAILGRPLDRRNFQKKMLERGVVERLAERRTGGAHRSPYLYRFTTQR